MNLEKPGKPEEKVASEFWKLFVLFKIALFKNSVESMGEIEEAFEILLRIR